MEAYERRGDDLPRGPKGVLYQMLLLETQEVVRRSLERLIALYEQYPSESLYRAILDYRQSAEGWRLRR